MMNVLNQINTVSGEGGVHSKDRQSSCMAGSVQMGAGESEPIMARLIKARLGRAHRSGG